MGRIKMVVPLVPKSWRPRGKAGAEASRSVLPFAGHETFRHPCYPARAFIASGL